MPVPRSILHQHQYHSQRLRRHRLQQQSHGRIGNRDAFLHGAVGLVPVGSHRLIIVTHDAAGAGSLPSLVADPDLPSGVMKGDGLSTLAVNAFHGRLVRSADGAPPFPGLVELVIGADPNRGAHPADLPGHRVLRMVHRYPDERERERRDCHTGAPVLGRYFQCKVWPADGSKVPPGGARTTCCPFRRLTASSCGLRARVMSIASNQMLLNFGRKKSPGGSSREMGELATVVGRTRCNASANLVWAFVMPAIRLIDTRLASHRRSLRKLFRAEILTAGPMAVFVAPF